MSSNFNGCRNNKPFNIARKNEIFELLDFKTDLFGINSIESIMYDCTQDKLTQADIEEIIEHYDKFENIVFPNKKASR